jgi:hypothetical protein
MVMMILPGIVSAEDFYVCDEGAACTAGEAGNPDWQTGSDSNPGTSRSEPFKTIQEAMDQVDPGDTVIVGDGIYTDHNSDEAVASMTRTGGTAGAWITFKAENKWGAVLDCENVWQANAIRFYSRSHDIQYMRFEDFELKRCHDAIKMNAQNGGESHDLYFHGFKIHDIGRHWGFGEAAPA